MSPDIVKPGATLRDILAHRAEIGNFTGNLDEYIADIRQAHRRAQGSAHQHLHAAERPHDRGRRAADARRRLGRDASGHHRAAARSNSSAPPCTRRKSAAPMVEAAITSFRERVESVLRPVSDSAAAMKSTATALFAASEQTSQRAQSALQASNEASTNVATAATAADEMAGSIGEISRQLVQTTDVVHHGGERGARHQ